MSVILRWFYDNGERHRAFLRQDAGSREPELVIARRGWERTVSPAPAPRLEDLSDEALISIARDVAPLIDGR